MQAQRQAKRSKKPDENIKDEPGAEERFKGILKRALNTPPVRKREATKRKPAARTKDKEK